MKSLKSLFKAKMLVYQNHYNFHLYKLMINNLNAYPVKNMLINSKNYNVGIQYVVILQKIIFKWY